MRDTINLATSDIGCLDTTSVHNGVYNNIVESTANVFSDLMHGVMQAAHAGEGALNDASSGPWRP
jgi:hypothetical protein